MLSLELLNFTYYRHTSLTLFLSYTSLFLNYLYLRTSILHLNLIPHISFSSTHTIMSSPSNSNDNFGYASPSSPSHYSTSSKPSSSPPSNPFVTSLFETPSSPKYPSIHSLVPAIGDPYVPPSIILPYPNLQPHLPP